MPDHALAREVPFGAIEKRVPGRRFEIMAKDFTSNEQAVPIRVLWGTVKAAGVYFTPIWGFRSVAIQTKVGK